MFHINDEGPISPMKKLKILSEHHLNVPKANNAAAAAASVANQIVKEASQTSVTPAAANPSKDHQDDETKSASSVVVEPLMQESPGQYVIFPINHADMWALYKSLVDNFWSFSENIQDMEKLSLNHDEKQFVKHFASIFASSASRGLVNENFAEEFCKLIQVTEAKFFYGHQLFVQNIHFEMYNKLLDKFAPTNEEK